MSRKSLVQIVILLTSKDFWRRNDKKSFTRKTNNFIFIFIYYYLGKW